tara:strand:- start:791 stop:1339 length:549 start_codon:yes stop_codon:yes gene_type:complete
MGLKILKSRLVRPWGVWVVTLILMILALVSFVIHPSVTLQMGTMHGGIARKVILEEGSVGYFRSRYLIIVDFPEPGPTASDLAWLDREKWGLDWQSGLREFERNWIGPIRNPVWSWFFPTRPIASSFTVPLVLPLMLFGVLSFYAALEERRRRRILAGLCGGCAYSLTGLDGGVCPECGEEM